MPGGETAYVADMRTALLLPIVLTLGLASLGCGRGPGPNASLTNGVVGEVRGALKELAPEYAWHQAGGGGSGGHGGLFGGGRLLSHHRLVLSPAPVATAEGDHQELPADLLFQIRERTGAWLRKKGAKVHNTGTSGGGQALDAFDQRYELGDGIGWVTVFLRRDEHGRMAILLVVSEHLW